MSIYLMLVMKPFKRVIDQIHRLMERFLCVKTSGSKGKHWEAWKELCYSNKEGGVVFRSLNTVAEAFFLSYGRTLE